MFIALISSILGIVGGIVPDMMKMARTGQDHRHERALITLQHKHTMARIEAKVSGQAAVAEHAAYAEEMQATREHLTAIVEQQGRVTGVGWVDVFNSILRPTMCTGVMAIFFVIATLYAQAIVGQYYAGSISALDMATVLWGSMVGESVQAVLGFLFGYRQARKAAAKR